MFRSRPHFSALTLALILPLLLEQVKPPSEKAWLPAGSPEARSYVERAVQTQQATLRLFGWLGGADSCQRARYLAYRREPSSSLVDAWYVAAQLQADSALARLGQPGAACRLERTVSLLDRLRWPEPHGGYYPRIDIHGNGRTTRDTYVDDNAFIGLALLEARAASSDAAQRAALLDRAEGTANFLIGQGLWDDVFGGGFWWNTNRGAMAEGKPAQATALAALLFARLYEETGQPAYRDWALHGLAWLDARLWDQSDGLYLYTIRHWDLEQQSGEYREPRAFGYDQGIILELLLTLHRSVDSQAGYLERARGLAERLHAAFWQPTLGGYRVSTDGQVVSAAYAAWISQSLLVLHEADPNPRWLDRARANLEALDARLLGPPHLGYANLYYLCEDPSSSGCEDGRTWNYDPTRYLPAQAFVQRAQAMLAASIRE